MLEPSPAATSPILLRRVGAIEDEQCQKFGGGYKAVKFKFLLFL
jgi:hypothetical protein